MSGRSTRRRALLAGVAVSLAACAGGSGTAAPAAAPVASSSSSPAPPSPSPLEEIVDTRFVRAHDHSLAYDDGWYVETTSMEGVPVMIDWVMYTAEWQDHRIGLAGDGSEPTAEHPTLRIVVERDRVSMWNPAVEEDCGTPWVDLEAGVDPGGLGEAWEVPDEELPIKPLMMIEPGRNQAREVADGEYVMQVRVGDALPPASEYRGPPYDSIFDRMVDATVVVDLAFVEPRIESVTIDFSELLREVTGEEVEAVMEWVLGVGHQPLEWDPPPVDVAHPDCLQERHEV